MSAGARPRAAALVVPAIVIGTHEKSDARMVVTELGTVRAHVSLGRLLVGAAL